MLQRSTAFKIEFSKPIQLRDGARLATTDHAQMFLPHFLVSSQPHAVSACLC
jgi:hypothetical protein